MDIFTPVFISVLLSGFLSFYWKAIAYSCARMHSCRKCLPVATIIFFHGLIFFFSVCTLLAASVALLYFRAAAAALCTAALAVLTVVPRCTHSIPGYALELFSLPMSSSLFVLFSLPGLSFIFACLLVLLREHNIIYYLLCACSRRHQHGLQLH